jgi:UDP-glucose 4-epimerase
LLRRAWIRAAGQAAPARFSGHSRPGDPFSLVADATNLAKGGFVFEHSLEQGVDEYVRWFHGEVSTG